MRRMLIGGGLIVAVDILLNFVSAHLGRTVLFALPDAIPGIGGPYTLEALAFGVSNALTIAAAICAAAPFSLLLESHDVMDALPNVLSRTGTAIAASLNLVPSIVASFAEVSEAQRFRGWRPRGPRSWAEVVVPVVLTSAESSIHLARSLESRGLSSTPRTTYERPRLDRSDWLVVPVSGLAVAAFAASRAAGWAADWNPYPSLELPAVDVRALFACALLFAPVLMWRRRT